MRILLIMLACLMLVPAGSAKVDDSAAPEDWPCTIDDVGPMPRLLHCGWIFDCALIQGEDTEAQIDILGECNSVADCGYDLKLSPPAQFQIVCDNDPRNPCELIVYYTSSPPTAEFFCLIGNYPVTLVLGDITQYLLP